MKKVSIETSFSSLREIKETLESKKIFQFYEKKNRIIIQKSNTIQVRISLHNGKADVEAVFPQIGNSVQVISSIILIYVGSKMNIPFTWVIGILLGQLIAFQWYSPKINELQNSVISALSNK
ncbi:MAG: hypothetical protein AB8F74_17490 [Saprospiraceae bacterium]